MKIEQVFQGNDDREPTMFGRYQRGRGRDYRGRGAQGGHGITTGPNQEPIGTARGGRKHNPTDREGKPPRCFICESMHKRVRDCPHFYKMVRAVQKTVSQILSLFVGLSSDCRESKIQTSLRETKDSAELDNECSKTENRLWC